MRRWLWFGGLLLVLLSTVIVVQSCGGGQAAEATETKPTAYMNLGAEATYVGKEECKACHADKYETYVQSQMGRSFKTALAKHSVADFDAHKPVYDHFKNMYYLPFRKGERLFLLEYRLEGKDTVYRREEKIDYIIGSGQHTNSHLMEENGYVYQMPLTWYAQDKKWDLPPGFENGENTRFERSIALECMTCHNGLPDFVEGSGHRYDFIPHGIDCERCHGPGSIHIERMKAGKQVEIATEIDYSIVNPGKLPLDLQFDLCQRCHLQGTAVPVPGKSFADFRPGMPLNSVLNVFLPRYEDSISNFIMASHPDRLRMSQCFLQSHAQDGYEPMTCITCHNPHLPIETYGDDIYNTACGNCHTLGEAGHCPKDSTFRSLEPKGCIGCHMPKTGSSDIPHVTITDHFIRKEPQLPQAEVDKQKAFFRLACRTDAKASHLTMAQGYLYYFEQKEAQPFLLDSALLHLRKINTTGPEKVVAWVHYYYLRNDYPGMDRFLVQTDYSAVTDAWTWYRMGEAQNGLGAKDKGLSMFEKAVALAPKHLHFRNKLAAAYMGAQRMDDAKRLLDEILTDNPRFGAALNNRGFLRVRSGDFTAGEADLRQALALDPDAVLPLANLASLYVNTGRVPEARPLAKKLLAVDPDNQDYQLLWNIVSESTP